MRFAYRDELPEDAFLEVWRSVDGERARPLRRARLDERIHRALTAEGFEFLDRAVTPGSTFRYQVRLRSADGNAEPADTLAAADSPTIRWRKPPAKPDSTAVTSPLPGLVEVTWELNADFGALVFRRNVLASEEGPERLAQLQPGARGTFVDRNVEPGGVYAYRVAMAYVGEHIVQFGPPSEEVYVTVAASLTEPDALD